MVYYCSDFSDDEKEFLPFVEYVDFGYVKTDKEYEEPIKQYLKDVKELKRQCAIRSIDDAKELELFERIENGDGEARNIIFINFLLYIPRIVKYYVGNGVAIEDLIQEGNIALLEAIDTFEFRYGYRFSTHLKWYVRRKVRLRIPFYLTSFDIPVQAVTTLRKMNKLFEEASMTQCEEVSIHKICRMEGNGQKELSLFYMINAISMSEQTKMFEVLEDLNIDRFEDEVVTRQLIEKIKGIMGEHLTDREENIIKLLYGLDDYRQRTLREVGIVFGISGQSIRNNEQKGLEKIRRYI